MREIKFRVWSKEAQIMLDWEHLLEAADLVEHLKYPDEDAYYSAIMQYTGLNDKNGKQIYEGDILKRKSNVLDRIYFREVVWEPQLAEFWTNGMITDRLHQALDGGYEWAGNIYEHPHLLKEESK